MDKAWKTGTFAKWVNELQSTENHSAANNQASANRVTFFPTFFSSFLRFSVTSTHWKKMSGPWEVPCTWGCRGFMARSWCSFTASQLMNLGRNGWKNQKWNPKFNPTWGTTWNIWNVMNASLSPILCCAKQNSTWQAQLASNCQQVTARLQTACHHKNWIVLNHRHLADGRQTLRLPNLQIGYGSRLR